jgi:acetyl/propionyl-CoA carboxylase alpha subunit
MWQGLRRLGSWLGVDPGDGMEARYVARLEKMAQTNKERQEALRARRAMLGMTEVRGIYLPPDLHASLKEHAAKLLDTHALKREKERK